MSPTADINRIAPHAHTLRGNSKLYHKKPLKGAFVCETPIFKRNLHFGSDTVMFVSVYDGSTLSRIYDTGGTKCRGDMFSRRQMRDV